MEDLKKFNVFINEQNSLELNESGVVDTSRAIDSDLQKFLIDVVIPKSKGYVKNERDAAILLFDVLKTKFGIKANNF